MEALLIVVALGALAWVIFVQVSARLQSDFLTSLSTAEIDAAVDRVFGTKINARVPGDGQINIRPHLKFRAPTISIRLEQDPSPHHTRVSVWMSNWVAQGGIVVHNATWVWRKKRALQAALTSAETP